MDEFKQYIYGWGFGKYGQIGKKFINYSLIPNYIELEDTYTTIISIEAGEFHSAILTNKSLYTFGKNTIGQLGCGKDNYTYIPLYNSYITTHIKKISLGGDHTLLLSETGDLYSFGLNVFGQLGTKTFCSVDKPTKVEIDGNVVICDIAAGAQHSIILSNEGSILTCGFAGSNALGIKTHEDLNVFTKVDCPNYGKITKIAAGVYHSSYVIDDELIYIFGVGDVIQFDRPTLCSLSSTGKITDIKIGDDFVFVLSKSHELYCMGSNVNSQLGHSKTFTSQFNKLEIPGIRVKEISVGYKFVIIKTLNNEIYGWGNNDYGQLTITNSTCLTEPTLLTELTNLGCLSLICGGYHCLGVFSKPPPNTNSYENPVNEYKDIIKQTMLNSTIKNDILNMRDRSRIIDMMKKDMSEKLSLIKDKDRIIKELKEKFDNSRGFDNNFEITLGEIAFEEESIGKGTFGEVRKGVWRKEVVAVKFLKDEMLNTEDNITTFIEECNILKNLRHPNILLFMGACTISPNFFIVTEYCDNGNLFELLHQKKNYSISVEERKRISLEIAIGMNFLHSFKPPILHRDLKTMNVLLDKNLQVKIADFGSAKILKIQMTKQKGTFQWMAPEVIKGSTYTEKADVFSFGIIMAEIATRQPPYYGVDKKEVARNVLQKPDYRPIIEKTSMPKEYLDLMKKCWEQNPNKRPSFSEVIDALKGIKIK
jgi:alpha-tubulin suppressor-like RCC1 family protein/predicted Ser/Thr protein kinase